MSLSRKAKEAIKVALAMTIAYGIALSMGWDKPNWAGFAVAFVSLASIGQSMNKAAMRMFGTLVAAIFAFILIALFSQQRWAFMLFLSLYVSLCTYLTSSGDKHAYFWQVCGFVCVVICLSAGPDSVNAFDTAILRAQETGLGILVYSLVAIFLWPVSSRADFNTAAGNLASIQHQLYQACSGITCKQGSVQQEQHLRTQVIQAKTRFDQLLDAAETDCREVWELRRTWRRYQQQAGELMHTLGRCRESFVEVQTLDLQRLLPNLEAFGAELDGRLAQIGSILAGATPGQLPQAMDLPFDKDEVRRLSHFHRAAVAVARSNLLHLEQLTRSLFGTVSELKGFSAATAPVAVPTVPVARFLPDLDRISYVVRFMAIIWLAWLAMIYVDGLPGGPAFVTMAGSMGISAVNMPQLSLSLLLVPAATSILFAGTLYIFIMPQLSSFMELGLLIFATTFAICYLFAAPQQILGRVFGLAMFATITSISNEQSYNFLSVATTALIFPLVIFLLALTSYIPFSPRPERVFLRLVGRFFRSSEYLMSIMHRDPGRPPTRMDGWRKAFHEREVATLPTKLGSWAAHLDTRVLPGTSAEQPQALVTSLQVLSYRMQQLLEARDSPQAPLPVQQQLEDFRAWRVSVQEIFNQLSEDPASGEREALRSHLDRIMGHIEARIMEAIDKAADGQVSDQDAENFYRLLGAYRGVSEALHDYAGEALAINWAPWHEERFA